MTRYTVVPATLEHARALAPILRAADVAELAELCREPLESLEQSVAGSSEAFAVFVDGEIVGIFGVYPRSVISDEAFPWLLGSETMATHARAIMVFSRNWVEEKRKQFRYLHNYVSPHNVAAIRWLRWLGFTVSDRLTPLGPKGAMMLHFEMRA